MEGELPNRQRFAFSQNVLIQDADFPDDPSLEGDAATIDPAVREPEKESWDSLIVRSGIVVIDHGWGAYTAYDHLSEMLFQPGDMVQPGQFIGLGGATGRTAGPHLHWEVWVGGVQVNNVAWIMRAYL